MKIPMFQQSESGHPLVCETYIQADGHLGTHATEVLEDRGTYYKVLSWEYVPYQGPKYENTYPDLASLMIDFLSAPF